MRVMAMNKSQMRGVGVQGEAEELLPMKRDIFHPESWSVFFHLSIIIKMD